MTNDTFILIQKGLNELFREFETKPNDFFNEHDFQQRFFEKLHVKLPLLHPEYPTRNRFLRKGPKAFPPDIKQGIRGHYDFAILKKDFYEKYKDNFDKISSKNFKTNAKEPPYLDYAIEFKFFTSRVNFEELNFDFFKLKNADELVNKVLVIFSTLKIEELNNNEKFEQIERKDKFVILKR